MLTSWRTEPFAGTIIGRLLYKFSIDIKSFFVFTFNSYVHEMKIEVLYWGGIQCIMTSTINYFVIQFS